MADENPYRKSMSPEDLAARQALLEQQNQYRLMQNQMKSSDVEEQIKQRFADVPVNQRPRLSSGFMSDDTYAPTLSQYIGGVSISPAIQDIEKQVQQKDIAISNLRGMYRNINRLAPDEEGVKSELDKYKKEIEELAGSKDRYAYQKAAILGEQFAQDLNSNRNKLGAAYSNYKAKLAHEEMLKKLLEKGQKDGGISPEDYNMAIKISDAEYAKKGGIGKGENNIYNSYAPVMPATYVDQNKVMNDAIANWNKDGRAWTVGGAVVDGQIVGQKYVNGVEGYIIKGTRNGKDTFISADEVRKNLAPVLGNDNMLQSYYKWQAKVNDFGTSDEGIVKFGQSTLNAITSDINKDKVTLASLEKLGKSKENIQKIENIKNRIAQNTSTAENYAQAAEKALTGDLTPLREIRQSELTSKYNRDLVNLGTAKTDFLDQERSNTIDVSADANYAEGQRIKNMVMGNQILKQNGQLVAQPRFKTTAEFGDFTKATNGQMLDLRKQLSELVGNTEPGIMNWDMATVKARLDEYANKALLTYTGSDKDKYSFAHSSAFKNLKSAFDETYQKQQYANQRYENAKAQVLKENPQLAKKLKEESTILEGQVNPRGAKDLVGLGVGMYELPSAKSNSNGELEKLIANKLATTKNLPSQSMMFPELRTADGKIDYKSSAGLRDVVKEFIGSNGKTDENGNITLAPNTLQNMKGVAVRLEGQDPNAEPTSLEDALKLEDGIDMSKSIQFGTNQLSFNVLSGDIVIPVRYTVDGGVFGKERVVEKDIHISTNESTGFTNEWLKNFNNSPDMKAKKSYTQALAEQQSGIATPQQYQGAVKYDLDNQKVIITYSGNKEVTYGLNEGLQQVSNLEKELNKLSQK